MQQKNIRSYVFEFSQEKAIEYDLSLKDLLILQWLIDFINSGQMTCHSSRDMEGNITGWWYWVTPTKILNDLPILKLSQRSLRKVFEKLEKKELIQRKIQGKKLFLKFDYYKLT